MIKVSKQQARARLKTLPVNIKESIFSETDAELIDEIGRRHHLAEDRIPDLALIISYIFLGFVRREDLIKELKEFMHLNPAVANELGAEINLRIVDPYKDDLDRIFKAPEAISNQTTENVITAPKPLDGISSQAPAPSVKPVVLEFKPKIEAAPSIKPTIPAMPKAMERGAKPVEITPSPYMPKPAPIISQNTPTVRPIASPPNIKQAMPTPSAFKSKSFIPTPTPPKPAKIELGGIKPLEKVIPPTKSETKSAERAPIRYSEPKNVFVPITPPIPENKGVPLGTPLPPVPPKRELTASNS